MWIELKRKEYNKVYKAVSVVLRNQNDKMKDKDATEEEKKIEVHTTEVVRKLIS